MKCINCQKELPDQARFCTGCGKKIPRCPTCGSLLTQRIRFCSKDGTCIPQDILDLIPSSGFESAKKSFCTRCGAPTAPGQKICDTCQSKAANTAAKKKAGGKKNRLWLIPVILLLILGLAAAGYYVVSNVLPDLSRFDDFTLSAPREEDNRETDHADRPESPEDADQEDVSQTAPGTVTEAPADVPTAAVPATEAPETEPSASAEAPAEPDPLASLKVGDTFFLGAFEQDNNNGNGAEAIEWIVLEKTEGRILVISRYLLDCRRYHNNNVNVSWYTCSLRTWLNEDFYQDAFTAAEKERILTFSDPDSAAEDKVFLLSLEQVEQYFTTKSSRICRATKYAVSRNAYVNSSTGGSWWLLRTAGVDDQHVVSINSDGAIDYTGGKVADSRGTVRPALWIRIQ